VPETRRTRTHVWAMSVAYALVSMTASVLAWPSSRAAAQERAAAVSSAKAEKLWRGVHLASPGHDGLGLLKRAISEKLAPWGVNVLILEVDYGFEFQSHPDLRGSDEGGPLRREDARELKEICTKNNIRLIPMFNCLGHQSWSGTTFSLLAKHPELDETPEAPKDNKGIYCRSWCPLHPEVNKIVFSLIDELIDAFGADGFHVGMDEVFLIASPSCPRCKGKDPAELLAKAINDLHQHITEEKKVTMLMWADRLLDDAKFKYGKWEASANGTAAAIDRIPKDIILCDWHYEKRPEGYPSVAYFQEKGYRVLPSTWRDKEAALAMLAEARRGASERMIGHLCTTWTSAQRVCRTLLDETPPAAAKPGNQSRRGASDIVAALKACMEELKKN
jgi:Glycosyl hydrolase family 20, catalytic domain